MRDNERRSRHKRLPLWGKLLVTLLIIGAAGILVWTQLPRGAYSTDLSRVGSGVPALVLARDINYVAGMEVMGLMNAIRADYAGRVEFLVAHLGTPDGRTFAQRHGAGDGTVLLFSGDGSRVMRLNYPQSEGELRRALHDAFSL